MTIVNPVPPIEQYIPPFLPLDSVSPFTYRDGETYQQILMGIKRHINTVLIPFINDEFTKLGGDYATQTNLLIDTVNAALANLDTEVNTALAAQQASVTDQLATNEADITSKIAAFTATVNQAITDIQNSSINLSDPVTYGILNNITTTTRQLLNGLYGRKFQTNAADYPTLQAAIDATATGGRLFIPADATWNITDALNVSRAMTIYSNGALIQQTSAGNGKSGFNIAASNVKISGLHVRGPQVAAYTNNTETGFFISGTDTNNRLTGIRIENCEVENWVYAGIRTNYVDNFAAVGNHIHDVVYAGIIILSTTKSTINNNRIVNVIQGTFVNSYGIAITRDSTLDIVTGPRSSDIVVDGNYIDGVTRWEAIDTHGGSNLTITNNKVRNSFIGIAMVPCPDPNGVDTWAPTNVIIIGNDLDSGKTDGTCRTGIQLVGAVVDPQAGPVNEYATGVIQGNVIRNFGTDGTSNQGGVFLQVTRGAIVAGNRIINSSINAISVYHNNQNTVIQNNILVDTWSNLSAFTACVYVSSVHNQVTIQGNRAVTTGLKTATKVNDRGMFFAAALTDNTDVNAHYSDNNFQVCTSPLIDSTVNQNMTFERHDARKIGFYGTTPVAKPVVTGSRGGNAAVASILAALASEGLITDSTTA